MVTAQQLAERMPDTRELLSDEPQMESTQHYQQLALLVSHLEWYWQDRADFFIGANLTVYYTMEQLRVRRFAGPGFLPGAGRRSPAAHLLGRLERGRALPRFDHRTVVGFDGGSGPDREKAAVSDDVSEPRSISGFRR